MNRQKRLDITSLTWDYRHSENNGWLITFSETPAGGLEEQKHSLLLKTINLHLSRDGGLCKMLYGPQCSGDPWGWHAFDRIVLRNALKQFGKESRFESTSNAEGASLSFWQQSGEHLTDTGMRFYHTLLDNIPRGQKQKKGPRVSQKTFLCKNEFGGWISFEDFLARKYDLPLNNKNPETPVAFTPWPRPR